MNLPNLCLSTPVCFSASRLRWFGPWSLPAPPEAPAAAAPVPRASALVKSDPYHKQPRSSKLDIFPFARTLFEVAFKQKGLSASSCFCSHSLCFQCSLCALSFSAPVLFNLGQAGRPSLCFQFKVFDPFPSLVWTFFGLLDFF